MIFTKDISQVNFDDIKQFFELKVTEGLKVDYKGDFPNDLAKLIAAFANSYGGIIFIGIRAEQKTNEPVEICGVELKKGLEEKVIGIAFSNITPPIIPEVKVVPYKSLPTSSIEDRAVVIVRVNESYLAPHQVAPKNSIWIRTFNQCDHADLQTIESLIDKRKNSSHKRIAEEEALADKATIVIGNEFEVTKRQAYMTIRIVPAYPTKTVDFSKTDDDFLSLQITNFLGGELPKVKPRLGSVEFRVAYNGITSEYFILNSKGGFLYLTPLPVEGDEGKLNPNEIAIRLDKIVATTIKIYKKYAFTSKILLKLDLIGVRNRLLFIGRGTNPYYKCPESSVAIDFEGNLESLRANNNQ